MEYMHRLQDEHETKHDCNLGMRAYEGNWENEDTLQRIREQVKTAVSNAWYIQPEQNAKTEHQNCESNNGRKENIYYLKKRKTLGSIQFCYTEIAWFSTTYPWCNSCEKSPSIDNTEPYTYEPMP